VSVAIEHVHQFAEDIDEFLLNAFPTGVIICDSDGLIIQVNNDLCGAFGYKKEELIGKPLETLLPTPLQQGHQSHVRNFLQNPEKRSMGSGRSLFGMRKDGTTFPVEIGLNPIQTADGTRVLATVSDISPRTRIEANFRKIIAAAPIGILIIDKQGKILVANQQITSIFGYELAELDNEHLEILIPERYRENHPSLRQHYQRKPVTRTMGSDRDLTGRHKNGSEVPVEVGLSPIETEDGLAIVATIIDVTARKKAELALKQANADLDEFTYVASHDLRSPLRGISSLIEWITEDLGEVPEEVQKNIDRMGVRIERMEKLIDDLLAYARAGRVRTTPESIDVEKMIHDTIEFIAPPQNFHFDVDCKLARISAHRTPLETVIRNLLSNAVKHHDKDAGQISVRVREDDSYAVFEIEDDGPGIPEAAHQRIFKLFQSLSAETNNRSGVGLAVSKRFVESHGGTIEIVSDKTRKGSLFRFFWPRFQRRELE